MKQVSQTYRTGELALVNVPAPALRPGGILVRNRASLISPGTERQIMETARKGLLGKARARPDLVRQVLRKARTEGIGPTIRAVVNRLDSPIPLGYSSAGIVIEVGEGADEFRPGDWVACAGAGYAVHAEVVFVPRNLAVQIPDAMRQESENGSPEDPASAPPRRQATSGKDSEAFQQAAFTTIGAVALQSVRIAEANIGEVVAVIGLGLVGLLTVQLLKAAGCRVLGMDPSHDRCRLAETVGCDATATTASEMERLATGRMSPRGVDAVILAAATSSNEPVELAGELCREKGRVVVVGAVGMDVPRRPFYEKELDLRLSRSYGPGRYDPVYEEKGVDYPYGYVRWTERRNMAAFLDLVAQGKVRVQPLISHHFPIERATEAYELIASGQSDGALGVVLTYPNAGAERPDPAIATAVRPGGGESRRPEAQGARRAGQVAIGLIGAGDFAKSVLLPGLKGEARPVTVCTATGLSAGYVARKFGFASSTTDSRTIFDDPEIDAVVIATRHGSHGSLVIDALRAGKHVFVEKPLALDESALRDVVRTADQHRQQTLMVDYNRRFAPMAQQLRAFVAEIDEPLVMHYRVNAGPLPPDHWVRDPVEGGGRIVGEVCHFVDFLTFLAGSLPARVHALAPPSAAGFRDDNVVITIDFANGSLGTITYVASGDSAFPKERVELFGGGKVGTIDDFRRLELVGDGRKKVYRSRLSQNKGHLEGLRAFIAAARDGGPPPIPIDDMVSTSLTTFRALESLGTAASPEVNVEGFLAGSAG